MSIFGKKGGGQMEDFDEGVDPVDGAGSAPDELAAPSSGPVSGTRSARRGGGGRTGLLLVLLLLLAGGGGGAYVYFSGMMGDLGALVPAQLSELAPVQAETPAADVAPPAPENAAPVITAETPPAAAPEAVSAVDPLLGPEATPAEAAIVQNLDSAGSAQLGTPPAAEETGATQVPGGPVPAPVTDGTAPAPVAVAADPAQAVVPPVADAAQPVAAPAPVAGDVAAAPAPVAEGTAAAPATNTAAPANTNGAGSAPAPVAEAAKPVQAEAELPPPGPQGEETISLAPTAAPAPVTNSAGSANTDGAGSAPAPAAEKAPAATAAEAALVDNAPVLDQMSHPAPTDSGPVSQQIAPLVGPPAPGQLPALEGGVEEALVRPLPNRYVIVKKDSASGSADARLTGARSALSGGRNQAALALFSEMRKEQPDDARIAMGYAVTLQRLGQNDEALAVYEEVLEKDPRNLEALTNMLGLLKNQDPTLAVDKLRELRMAYPSNADITAQLGVALGVAGDYGEALKYLDMADALAPGNIYVLYNRAIVHDRRGNSAEAAALYRRVLAAAAEGGAGQQQLPLDVIRARLGALR